MVFINSQRQNGTSDCCLFALAFATALCCDKNPSIVKFNQKQMKCHLKDSLENGVISKFPSTPQRQTAPKIIK
jgi:hypothetical protein